MIDQPTPRIAKLLNWAMTHSPRSRELHRLVQDMHTAFMQDISRLNNAVAQLHQERNMLMAISLKILEEEQMNDDEFRLWTAGYINQLVAPLLGTAFKPEDVLARAEIAFDKARELGASVELIEDMRTQLKRTLRLDEKPDEETAEETPESPDSKPVAVESSGG